MTPRHSRSPAVYFVFKSIPEYFEKELRGLKPNTVRRLPADDPRSSITAKDTITIQNTVSGQYFRRTVTDVTTWEDLTIISWEHEHT